MYLVLISASTRTALEHVFSKVLIIETCNDMGFMSNNNHGAINSIISNWYFNINSQRQEPQNAKQSWKKLTHDLELGQLLTS